MFEVLGHNLKKDKALYINLKCSNDIRLKVSSAFINFFYVEFQQKNLLLEK